MKKYDLIVIGGGSGLGVSSAASSLGKKVAIVEEGPLGGTCLNRGCIPSKALLHAADIMHEIKEAKKFGINVQNIKVNFKKTMEWMRNVTKGDPENIRQGIEQDKNSTLYPVRGKFTGEKTLKVGNEEIYGEKIVIAAGTRPFIPKIEGLEETGYLTSDTVWDINKQPKTIAIIGGGYIGSEFAYFFSSLGTKVTVVQRGPLLMERLDQDISKTYNELIKDQNNLRIEYNKNAFKFEKKNGKKIIHLKDINTGKKSKLSVDEVFIAVGRKSNSDLLEVEKTKVKTDKKGYIKTNNHLLTSHPDIYALGDIIGKYLFKHIANYEADIVTRNLLYGRKDKVDYHAVPYAAFTYPQIAAVGLTEQEAKEKGYDITVGKMPFTSIGKAYAIGETKGMGKIIIDNKTDKILGAHFIGYNASEYIHALIVAMNAGNQTYNSLVNSIYIHPTMAELILNVVYNALNNKH